MNTPLLKETDGLGDITTAWWPERNTIISTLPVSGDEHIATIRLGLQHVESNPDWVLASLRNIDFTVGNIGCLHHAANIPESQQLLCALANKGKSKDILAIVKKIGNQWAVWKFIDLYMVLIENGHAEEIWELIQGMDFEKEKKWFFWDRYLKLLTLMEQHYTNSDISAALSRLR